MTQTFADLGVPATLADALAEQGITTPFPIQSATLPDALAGRDVLGRGRTGSGKTYAFVLPLLARLAASSSRRTPKRPRALILAPTRELAGQIDAVAAPLARLLGLRTLTVYGGVRPNPQIQGLRQGVDVVIACPGRLADHVGAGHADLGAVEITVLDEADHMADLGFLPEVRRLLDRTPQSGQRLLFSATLDRGVDVLVRRYLHDPVTHSVDPDRATVTAMTHHVLHVGGKDDRLAVLADLTAAPGRTVVFTRTKHGAKNLARQLGARGIPAVELHGNLSQGARTRNLAAFGDGTASTLVATDIAARGIHVDDVGLVVHADPPVEHKAYLHRSGRTARAGASGTVVTLALDSQLSDVRTLTRLAGIKAPVQRIRPGDDLLTEIAPGERSYGAPVVRQEPAPSGSPRIRSGGSPGGRSGSRRRRAPQGESTGGRARTEGGRGRPARSGGQRPAQRTGQSHSAASFSASGRGR